MHPEPDGWLDVPGAEGQGWRGDRGELRHHAAAGAGLVRRVAALAIRSRRATHLRHPSSAGRSSPTSPRCRRRRTMAPSTPAAPRLLRALRPQRWPGRHPAARRARHSDHWANQVPALVDHFAVVVIDSRGQGRSGHTQATLTYDVMAEDVVAVMDALKIRARVGGRLERRRRGRAQARHRAPRPRRSAVRVRRELRRARKQAAGQSHRDVPGLRRPLPRRLPAADAVTARLGQVRRRRAAAVSGADGSPPTSCAASRRRPSSPTATTTRSSARPGSGDGQADPHAKLVVFDDASHFALWQDPVAFNRAMVDFLTAK